MGQVVTLNGVTPKTSKTGKTYYTLDTSSGNMTSWAAVPVELMNQQVEVETETNQYGTLVKSIKLVTNTPPTSVNPREHSIEQQVAIKEVGEHSRLDPERIPEDILDAYWKWIRNHIVDDDIPF